MSIEVTAAQRAASPYRDVGFLVITWPNGDRYTATAVLVGRNDILTAAHAVYNPALGGWASSFEVYFGADYNFVRSAFDDPGTTVRTVRWSALTFATQAYADNDPSSFTQAESQYDLALLGVDTAPGDSLGWLGLAAGHDGAQSALAIGYPAGSTGMQVEQVNVTSSSSVSLYESAVAVFGPGSSGGPLLVNNQVIGIKSTSTWWADVGGAGVNASLVQAMASNDTLLNAQAKPSVTSFSPADGATTVAVSANMVLQFSEMVRRGTGTLTLQTADGRTVESFDAGSSTRLSIAGDTLTLDPTQNLSYFTSYRLVVADGAVKSLGTQAYAGGSGYDFYTGGVPIAGTASDDTFTSTALVEEITGGAGVDVAVYDGAISGYGLRVDRAARTAIVVDNTPGRDGADLLRQVEKVAFGAQVFDLFNPPRTAVPAYGANQGFLFDAAYYLLGNPALASSLTLQTAFSHYLSTGAARGLTPNTWFDAAYYANRWADLKQGNFDTATLFAHYNLYGVWEGRSAGPVFDTYDGSRYLRDNPDVAAYVDAHVADFLGSRSNGAIAHYVIYGADEGRKGYALDGTMIESAVVIGVV